MSLQEKQRKGSYDSAMDNMRSESGTPLPHRLAVPRGSEVFQSALTDVLEEMKKQRVKESGEEEELIEEERDKFPESQTFRKLSDNTHNRRSTFRKTNSFSLKDNQLPQGRLPLRRHSIATIEFKQSHVPR